MMSESLHRGTKEADLFTVSFNEDNLFHNLPRNNYAFTCNSNVRQKTFSPPFLMSDRLQTPQNMRTFR